jgi:DNA-binding CsgD family transcriptional regulator
LAEVLVPRGQLDAAERALEAANEAVGRDADVIDRIWILRPMIALARARRRIDAVRTAVEQALAISGDPTHDAPLWGVLDIALGAEADAAEAAAARRDDVGLAAARAAGHRLADLAEEAADAAAKTEPLPPTLRAIRLRVTAERARLDGRPDPRAWSRAAAAFDAVPNPFEAAVSRFREAEAMLVSGAPRGRATEPLRAAFDVATRLRAEPLRDELLALGRRARIDLEELAAGDRPEGRAPADDANAHGLTAREREVLGLLARGLSNREIGATLFISEKTASVHVSNLLGKLGVSGRGAAAAIAVRLELDDPEGSVGGS